jgi:Methylase of chemotaxis methyl-accepting proteins
MAVQRKETIDKNPEPSQAKIGQFPIVGIGASAGGLNAIQKLLENLPENTGLTFVVIQHLAATQESMLPEILSRSTKMPVNKVANEMPVEINHVYVIPSGVTMTISGGILKLHPKGASFKPIDEFLGSLATDQKTRAIGIILSGTGSDGTEGLKLVKAEGGITFAQDPKTAQYPDMPRNAIAEETTYYILSPEEIAQEISSIAKHPEITRQKIEIEEPQKKEGAENEIIFAMLQAAFGVNFANYKQSTVNRRISRRIILTKTENLNKYLSYLRTHKEELQALFDDLLIGVTGFFREPSTFELFKEKVFPSIFEKRQPNQPIRIWIPGCSTGEEVYSIAILLEEFLEEKNIVDREIQIFGTDINEKNIEKARHGEYQKRIEDNVSKDRLKRFFISNNGNYQVIKSIRDMCVFAKHDLTRDPPFSNMNLIVCRNLLIYFDSKLQERIIPLFHYGLKPDGYLVLGESESVGKSADLFDPLTKKGAVFKKKQAQPTFQLQLEPSAYTMKRPLGKPEKAESMGVIEREVDKLLMAEYVPASLLLNNNLDIVVFRGKIDPYISIDAGAATLNAIKIVQKELRPALQTAVYRSRKDKKNVEDTIRFEHGQETRIVNIQVKPVKIPKQEELFFFVLFSEAIKERVPTQKEERAGKKALENAKDQQIKELSEDLNSTKLTLQTIIEQQEATNEELRSSMEEVQSSNEELMSTNEELESSKEELQSTNEELTTLNEELKNRNQTLTVLNDDLGNLMGSVETAVVIVDNSFKIRRFTSQAQELLRLMPTDVDHHILDIRLGIPVEELEKSLNKVTSTLELIREEIKTEKGRWYQMRIRPYLTSEKKVNGAILSFSDVTEMKKVESQKQVHTDTLEQQVKDQAGKLVEAETLSAIGKTAGMVGHDIRNPLQSIASDIYLAKTDLSEMPEGNAKEGIKESLESVEKNVEYINKIVQDLQDYAKPNVPVAKETDLEALCQEVLFKRGVPENIVADCKVTSDVEKIIIDQSMLHRVLSNLVNNAVQAMPKGGKLVLSAYKDVDYTVIEVQDSGVGIPEAVKSKLFTPLFTTKAKGQGFGLAVVKRLTETMGGTVTYESELGKGTKFIIRLPPPPIDKR